MPSYNPDDPRLPGTIILPAAPPAAVHADFTRGAAPLLGSGLLVRDGVLLPACWLGPPGGQVIRDLAARAAASGDLDSWHRLSYAKIHGTALVRLSFRWSANRAAVARLACWGDVATHLVVFAALARWPRLLLLAAAPDLADPLATPSVVVNLATSRLEFVMMLEALAAAKVGPIAARLTTVTRELDAAARLARGGPAG